MQTPLVRYMLRPHQNLLLGRCSSASLVPVPRRQVRLLSSSRPKGRSRKKSTEDPSSPTPLPRPRMASQRTVADVLMGAARAAAEKKAKKSAQPSDAVPAPPLKKSKIRDSQNVTVATLPKEEKEEKRLELEPKGKGFGFDSKAVSSSQGGQSIHPVFMGAARAAAEKKAKKAAQAPDAAPAPPLKKSKTRGGQNVTNATLNEENEEKNLELELRKKGPGSDPNSVPPPKEKKTKKSSQAPDATLIKEEKEEKNAEFELRKKGPSSDPNSVSSKDGESIPPVAVGAAEKKEKKSAQAQATDPVSPLKKSNTRGRRNITDATLVKEEKEEKNLELELRKKGPCFDPDSGSSAKDGESIPPVAVEAAEKKGKKLVQAPNADPASPLKKSKTRGRWNVTDATLVKEDKEDTNLELEPRKKEPNFDPNSGSSSKDGDLIPPVVVGAAEKKAKKSDTDPASPLKKSKTRGHQNVNDATLVKEEKEEKNLELDLRKKGPGFDPNSVSSSKDGDSIPPVALGTAEKKSAQTPDADPTSPWKKSKTRGRQNVTDSTLVKEEKEEKNLELEPRKNEPGFVPNSVPMEMEKKAKKSTQAPDAVPSSPVKKSKTRGTQKVTDDATIVREENEKKNLELELKKKGPDFDRNSASPSKEKKVKKSTPAPDAVPASPVKKSKTRGSQKVTNDATPVKEENEEKNLELEPRKKEPSADPTSASPSKEKKAKKSKTDAALLKEKELKNLEVELRKKGSGFDPKSVASWKDGESIPFLFIARALDLISNESGRIAIADILTNVFRAVIATTPGDLVSVVHLSANKIAPPHEGLELGIGDATIIRALAEAYGRKEEHVKNQLKELGDLGLVAKASRLSQRVMFKPKPLTVSKVLHTFRSIAKESGKESQDKKRNHIKGLLVAATDCEPQYIIRLLQSKMRIGLAEQTVLISLGQAAVYHDKSPTASMESSYEEATKIVKQVYSVLPDYDKIIPNLLEVGVWKLPEVCKFSLGVPVKPMLAKPTKGVSEILDKFQGVEFTCEYKYDGERAQIHFMEDGSVEIYSRNAERNTGKFPDVVASVSRFKKPSVKSFVLDCEVVAYDRQKQKILPFQILSTRARKDVAMSDIKVEVCTFAFDLLFLNGEDLLQQQLKDRRQHLYNSFVEIPGYFQFATALTSTDLEEIQKFLQSAMDASCEGLIIKTMDGDATYEPSKRSNNWLKLKKDYMDSIGDSLDLVPIAAFHGRGKRTGVYGSFLLACYDEQNEEYQSICNIGTGFSEMDLEERSSSLRGRVIPKPKPYYRFGESLNPDVWFEPAEVWEVKAADLSISPVHRAAHGAVDPVKGISLRFPRLLRIRVDKNPEQATTAEQVAELYRAQKINHVNNNNLTEDNDDD